jgi:hypothetical protein
MAASPTRSEKLAGLARRTDTIVRVSRPLLPNRSQNEASCAWLGPCIYVSGSDNQSGAGTCRPLAASRHPTATSVLCNTMHETFR